VGWWVPPPLGSTEKLGRSTLGSDRGTAQRFYPYTAAGRPSLLHHLFLSLSAGCTADCPILKMLPPPVTRLRTRQQTAGQTDFGGAVGWWVPPPLGSTEKLGRSTLGSDRGTAQRFYPYTAAGRPSLLHHLFLLSLLGALPIARF
jgi:hypothetical protein